MKVAIVHEYLGGGSAAERVLEHIIDCFPDADLFSLVDFSPDRNGVSGKPVRTSFIQRLPFAKDHYAAYRPIFPLAVGQFDLKGYDVVISSSSGVAKGVVTHAHQLHISYMHSPFRYVWGRTVSNGGEPGRRSILRKKLSLAWRHYSKAWDLRTARNVDEFIATSRFVSRRIAKLYGRQAKVLHPPADSRHFPDDGERASFYLAVAGGVSDEETQRETQLVVQAFSATPWRTLTVIARGNCRTTIKRMAAVAGPNVTFLADPPVDVVTDHLRRARAFVCVGEGNLDVTSLEAQAFGTPVIALRRGSTAEWVVEDGKAGSTGLFFDERSSAALHCALDRFELRPHPFQAADCRQNAERFSVPTFKASLVSIVQNALIAKKRTALEAAYEAALRSASQTASQAVAATSAGQRSARPFDPALAGMSTGALPLADEPSSALPV